MCLRPFPIFVLWLFKSIRTSKTSDCSFLLDPAPASSQAQARLLSTGPCPWARTALPRSPPPLTPLQSVLRTAALSWGGRGGA